ncbi:alpha/beta hydrolase [Nocardia sp. NPDC051570]|uniref:alpha/beta hydrolase n=1 Tax=Nocardia sp. NPDC051570 TaxID=3364324 RepID=UPI0037933DB6
MRHDVEFDAEGVTLRGWFYEAEGAEGPAPCVVMAHGWSATRRLYLDRFAEVFADAGMCVLVWDNRGFGDSGTAAGKPRYEIDPWEQIRDYQHGISYAQLRPEVDPARIAVWGSSFSAGHAFVVAAIDQRVRAVCGQAPFVSGRATYAHVAREDDQVIDPERFAADRRDRAAGKPPVMIPVIGTDPARVTGIPTPDAYEWFDHARRDRAPEWRNEVTLRSLELLRGYEPALYLPLITPTPLLMIVGSQDGLTGGNLAASAFETAAEPKRIVFIPGGHFAAYSGSGFEIASAAARDWFLEHLGRRQNGQPKQPSRTGIS